MAAPSRNTARLKAGTTRSQPAADEAARGFDPAAGGHYTKEGARRDGAREFGPAGGGTVITLGPA